MDSQRSDAFVFFGATGDLAYKQIFPALHGLIRDDDIDVPIIGIARSGNIATLRERARQSIASHGNADPVAVSRLLDRLRYVKGSYNDLETFRSLRRELGGAAHPLHYMAIPPAAFGQVIVNLRSSGCDEGARVIVEKPFGRDLASAHALNGAALEVFTDASIFRIDHFLGKEAVQNLLYFRFANAFLEPIWNRDRIASVEVTLAEDFDVNSRGVFYDGTGAIRDVVQNHLLQIVSLLAMEIPSRQTAEATATEKYKVLDSIRSLRPEHVVRGQYHGYHEVEGVASDSTVETFAAVRLEIATWRWAGVPFYLRTGKCLPLTATEILVRLKKPPIQVFEEHDPPDGNYLRFQLAPINSISIGARTKKPGAAMVGEHVELYACDRNDAQRPPYQRLIADAMNGNHELFATQDMVESAWRIVDGILDNRTPIHRYNPGSWGPVEANGLRPDGDQWHVPTPGHHSP